MLQQSLNIRLNLPQNLKAQKLTLFTTLALQRHLGVTDTSSGGILGTKNRNNVNTP
jgi:hypothetical protein